VFSDESNLKSYNPFQVYTDDLARPIDEPLCPPRNVDSKSTFVRAPSFDVFCDESILINNGPLKLDFEIPNNVAPKTAENSFNRSKDLNCGPLNNFISTRVPKTNEDLLSVFRNESNSTNQEGRTKSKNLFLNVDFENEEPAHSVGSVQMNSKRETPTNTVNTPLPLIIPVNLQDTPLEPENKENQPPKDYTPPYERRPLSGILTPATDIPVQEQPSDDSDLDDERSRVSANYCEIEPVAA